MFAQTYTVDCDSRAKRLRSFLRSLVPGVQAEVLRTFWAHRQEYTKNGMHSDLEPHVKGNFLAMVARLEGSEQPIDLEVIDAFTDDSTLAELIEAIQRDIQANKPNAVLDRLHTYSMKKFAEGRIRTTATDTLSPINAANLIEAHHRIESATTRSEIVLEGWDGQQV